MAPGGSISPSDTASVNTAISNAPAAWAASAMGLRSVRLPKTPGVCTTTQETVSSIRAAMSSAPAGSAGSATRSSPASREMVSTTCR